MKCWGDGGGGGWWPRDAAPNQLFLSLSDDNELRREATDLLPSPIHRPVDLARNIVDLVEVE